MAFDDLFIDVSSLPETSYGIVQLIFLTLVYGYILFVGSNLISDGSELLLLVPSLSGIVGSIVLPVFGAIPDGAVVLYSGLESNAQDTLSVGVGALAGSSIMLLTLPYGLSIIAGRVNLNEDGTCNYKSPKLTPPNRFFGTGVQVLPSVRTAAILMLISSVSYYIIEIPALVYFDDTDDEIASLEQPYYIGAFSLGFFLMLAYLAFMYIYQDTPEKKKAEEDLLIEKISSGTISLVTLIHYYSEKLEATSTSDPNNERMSLVGKSELHERVKHVLKPFFSKYDTNGNGTLDLDELQVVFKDLGEDKALYQVVKTKAEIAITASTGMNAVSISKFPTTPGGKVQTEVDLDGFVRICLESINDPKFREEREKLRSNNTNKSMTETLNLDVEGGGSGGGGEDEEEEEVPEDLASLSYEDQQFWIKFRALWMMLLGTTIVVIFSDPIVDCFYQIGVRLGINPFYVSFVLAPLASNASEIVASFNYAMKKTSTTISISLSALYGAAVMNNTFVFGLFMVVCYVQSLYYEFFAETLAILIVEILVFFFAMKNVLTVWDAMIIFVVYPSSIALVYALYLTNLG